MKRTSHFARWVFTVLVMIAVMAFVLPPVRAATGTISSSVEIWTPLTVNGIDAVAFGTLTAPTDPAVCAEWTLSAFDGLNLTAGVSEDPVAGDHSRGLFRLMGQPGAAVSYSVAVTTDFADPDLTLTVSNSNINPLSAGILDAATGILEVEVGGVLQICSGVVKTTHNDAIITMTANY